MAKGHDFIETTCRKCGYMVPPGYIGTAVPCVDGYDEPSQPEPLAARTVWLIDRLRACRAAGESNCYDDPPTDWCELMREAEVMLGEWVDEHDS